MKKVKKKVHINLFNLFVFITIIVSGGVLIHDLLKWAIIPLFTKEFYCMTYFGFFVDLTAAFVLDTAIQCLFGE